MPKHNDLHALLQVLLDEPVAQNRDYFLFMLGTDTVYTHRPTYPHQLTKDTVVPKEQRAYVNGESLSYMARVVADRLGENDPEINIDQPLSFSTPSVDVVNGPTTLGSEVGERIAQGVFLILKALAEGKQNIQISAHSRGAVESILIAHEIERIKTELNTKPSQTIHQIMANSPCTYTSKAVKKLFADVKESPEVRTKLADRLSSAKINMFLMDPVPGGSWRGIGKFVAWRDERFYVKPPCSNAELLIFRDERTRCFIPIKFKDQTPLILPGHHGTASGNLYTQQFDDITVSGDDKDSSLVQKLAIVKLLNFINNSTGLFDRVTSPVALEHPALDEVANQFFSAGKQDRVELLLEIYKKIQINDKAYRYFNGTSYAYLGSEASSSGARYIHADGHNYTSLDSLSPSLGGQFINKEHAFLYLLKHMEFKVHSDEYQPDALITQLGNVLNSIFTGYVQALEPKAADMSSSLAMHSQALLDSEADRKATFEAISVFLESISQKYLRNHLSLEVKTNLLAEIDKVFATLQQFKRQPQDAPINKIIDECDLILRSSLKNTAQIHYVSLIDQSNELNARLKNYLVPNTQFKESFNIFLEQLGLAATEENERSYIIRSVINALKEVSPVTVINIKTVLNEQLQALQDGDHLEKRKALAQILECTLKKECNLDRYFELDTVDDASSLTELDLLYDNIDTLINGFDHVKHLAGAQPIDINIELLSTHRDRVIKLAAEILIKKNWDLHDKPANIKDVFFQKVKAQAIALGGVNPEVADLFKDIKILRSHLNENSERIEQLSRAQQDQNLHIKDLYRQNQQVHEIANLNKSHLERLTNESNQTKEAYRIETEQLKRQQQQLTIQLSESQSALQRLTEQLSENKSSNALEVEQLRTEQLQLTQQLKDRTQQLKDSKAALERLNEEYSQNKEERSAETEQLKRQQQQLTTQLSESQSALQRLTDELTENKSANAHEVEQLKEAQIQLTQQLTESKAALEELNAQLLENKNSNAREVAELKKEQLQLIQQISEDRVNQGQLATELERIKQSFAKELLNIQQNQTQRIQHNSEEHQKQIKAQERLIQQLVSPKEMTCTQLIETKLIPLTKGYLDHLLNEAKRLNPSINAKTSYDILPDLSGDESDQQKYLMIANKYTISKNLLNQLEDKDAIPLPSDRITQFAQTLKNNNAQLKQHRDSEWMQFFKNCMVSIGIICTGIIPGLIALAAYSSYTGKSPLFFTRSQGDEYSHQVADKLDYLPISVK
ncbi:hypothetical protein [Legionella bononiensis]|uniref:hypothetical protein n=1 Tax=Legionella bononiensis TaxID=2793102 RepID=UPI001931D926|nr:hypothetical protein [Legionella bononiensis]MBL7479244.1 hypothetical protein [Legionella bononiensis]